MPSLCLITDFTLKKSVVVSSLIDSVVGPRAEPNLGCSAAGPGVYVHLMIVRLKGYPTRAATFGVIHQSESSHFRAMPSDGHEVES